MSGIEKEQSQSPETIQNTPHIGLSLHTPISSSEHYYTCTVFLKSIAKGDGRTCQTHFFFQKKKRLASARHKQYICRKATNL